MHISGQKNVEVNLDSPEFWCFIKNPSNFLFCVWIEVPHIEVSEVGGEDGGGGGGVIITSDSIARIRLTGRLLDLAMVVAASFYVFCQQVQEVEGFE